MFYKRAVDERRRLQRVIQKTKLQLKNMPEGKLYVVRDKERFKFYQCIDGKQHYISKKNRSLAEKLAHKKYLTLYLKELEKEANAIDYYLRHHVKRPWESEQLALSNSQYQELLFHAYKPSIQEYMDWANASYEGNPHYLEHLKYTAVNGKKVRSKSEVLISIILSKYKIPYRYECALKLGETTVYPDFTIIHPETGKIYYFEHLGRLDDPRYRRNNMNKLSDYIDHGIIPMQNLIITWETSAQPLDIELVEKIVRFYFVDN